ncbi:MAG: ATP-dependent zinc metalloprotease FtsH [bacterium ADurb.Bin425]|nr:MAG: ATP-dependent zinc metalloprotease FtsH [bacterium ADurb.Bin425]
MHIFLRGMLAAGLCLAVSLTPASALAASADDDPPIHSVQAAPSDKQTPTATVSSDSSYTNLLITSSIVAVLGFIWWRARRKAQQEKEAAERRRAQAARRRRGNIPGDDDEFGTYDPYDHQLGPDEPYHNEGNWNRMQSSDNSTKSPGRLILPSDPDRKTFKDVAGQPEAVERLTEICSWLKDPEVYRDHDADLPTGILLSGPAGTGKTLLASALAGEADASMLVVSGSAFVEMYVGVGAGRIRALFEQAKNQRKRTQKPVIIFIDEIDAVGGKRANGASSNSEREQTLNQLLVEMDGFQKNTGIIVIAATNRPDMLDDALRRKGRFDLDIPIDLPDTEGRRAIFAVHTRKKVLADDLDLDLLARRTSGFSGADIKAACNEAAIIAARTQIARRKAEATVQPQPGAVLVKEKPQVTAITTAMFDEAISVVEAGEARRSRLKAMKAEDKRQTAFHELGHAVVNLAQKGDSITKITILPRGRALGYVQTHSEGDRFSLTDVEMRKRITMALAGRAAQEIFLKTVDTGASNDFEQAWNMAVQMVTRYGMSSLGPLSLPNYGSAQNQLGIELANAIDKEIREIVAACDKEARSILEKHRHFIEAMASELSDRETILGPELTERFQAAQAAESE